MKIIDVRDGFIKFEADGSIVLSSMIKVKGESKDYIAQVIQKKENIAFAKILFILSEGSLADYDKTLPSINAEITNYTEYILKNFVKKDLPVIAGKMTDNINNIVVDAEAFNKKTIISVDEKNENNVIVKNLTKQLSNIGKRTIIIDTLGIINSEKFVAGRDFKLPLDTNSLKFMYENCLEDATQDSKSTIIEIFKSLAEYSQTVPFVPFKTLKTIVDDMVEKSHVFKLLVLKNKLARFDKLNYFATERNDVDKIEKILSQNLAIIDLSNLDTLFMNRFLDFVYEHLKGKEDVQVILELSNSISKKQLKQSLISDIPAMFVTHSNFNYLNELKNFFENYIVTPSIRNNQIFRIYATFLKAMEKGTFLITGKATNYVPFVSDIKEIDEFISIENAVQNEQNTTEPEIYETNNDVNIEDDLDKISNEPENEEYDLPQESQDKFTTAIDEQSNAAIEEVTENLEIPEVLDMFSEDGDIIPEQDNSSNIISSIEEQTDTDYNSFEEISLDSENNSVMEYSAEETDILPETEADSTNEEIITLEPENNETEISSEDVTIDNESEIEFESEYSSDENAIDIDSEDKYETLEVQENDEYPDNINDTTPDINIEPVQDETENSEIVQNDSIEEETIDISDIDIPLDNSFAEEQSIVVQSDVSDTDSEEELYNTEEANTEAAIVEKNNDELDFDEIIELDPSESDDNDIVVDLEDDFAETVNEDAEEQIAQDVDKVFSTRKEDNSEFSDSDLDFIDELNNDEDSILEEINDDEAILKELEDDDSTGIIEEYQAQEPVTAEPNEEAEILERREAETPIVPVYDAEIPQEDLVESDPIEQGDSVVHAKYGNGIVEKMIKYGSKTLYSINFENIGRRLLDPTLTEIKKA